jgi:predicted PurR-regulated permease PerM
LPSLVGMVKGWFSGGIRVPEQLKSIPLVGERVYDQLSALSTDRAQMSALLQRALEPAGKLSVAFVRMLGDGIVQLLLVTFIAFFYYRDGERIAAVIQRIAGRLSGEMSAEVLDIFVGTTRSVFIGIVGTAAAQGLAAFIGFLIAGVPAAFLLSVGTFVLSVVPMGPVLLWGGAAVWLYLHGETGWAIFMVVWGAVVISSIDNFLKPLLIARGSTLSLGLIFLGVLGGVFAFGFIGVILGPVLLALGVALGRAWITAKDPGIAQAAGIATAAAETSAAVSGSTPTRR